MARSAILAIKIVSDAQQATKGFGSAKKEVSGFEKNLGKANKVALAAGGAVVALGRSMYNAADEAATLNTQIATAVDNAGHFGDAHDDVAARIIDNANELARTTGINPNEIRAGAAMLSTYDSIAATADEVGGTFDRLQQSAIDLSAQGLGSVESMSKRLARALDDPVRGIATLRRVGINLTEQQQDQIKAMVEVGDVAGAQEIMLAELEGTFGGMAEATASASDKMRVKWQLAREEIGEKLAPAFDTLYEAGMKVAEFVADHTDAVVILMGVVAGLAGAVITVNAAYRAYAAAKGAALLVTRGFTAAVALARGAVLLFNAAMLANPIGVVILALTAVVALFVALYNRSETFRAVVDRVMSDVSGAIGWVTDRVSSLASWIGTNLVDRFQTARDIGTAAINAYTAPIRTVVGWVQDLVDWIGNISWPSPPGWMQSGFNAVTSIFGEHTPPGAGARYAYGPSVFAAPGELKASNGGLALSRVGGGNGSGGDVHIHVSGYVGDEDRLARVIGSQLDAHARRRGGRR